jgi:DNA-binding NarL/FixJ family response regulator
MPEVDGIEATRRIATEAPDSNVVVLTSFSDRERILEALDAGAVGYVLKDAPSGDVKRAVRAAVRGESVLDPRAARVVLTGRSAAPEDSAMTARERQVLELLGAGLPNRLIAARLGITEATVKAHITRIFQAIGVTDRTQAALWAQRHHLD